MVANKPIAMTRQNATPVGVATVNIITDRYVYIIINPTNCTDLTLGFPDNPQDGDIVELHVAGDLPFVLMAGGLIEPNVSVMPMGFTATWLYDASVLTWKQIG